AAGGARPHPRTGRPVPEAAAGPVAAGDIGRVGLRRRPVMSGYWHDAAAPRAAFTADGFLRTGDLGWVDDRDRLRLVGRTKEMYVRGGDNGFPVEGEAGLSNQPAGAGGGPPPRVRPGPGERRQGRARRARRAPPPSPPR